MISAEINTSHQASYEREKIKWTNSYPEKYFIMFFGNYDIMNHLFHIKFRSFQINDILMMMWSINKMKDE